MRVAALVALVAAALSAERAAAATTCPVQIQSQALSTLTDPIVVSSAAGSSSSASGSSSGKKNNNSTGSSSDSGSAGASGADVGSDGSNTGGSTDGTTGSVGGSGSAGVTNSPTSTTATPTSTTKTPSSTTATPTSTTKTPSSTTAAPTTSSGSSSTGGSDTAGSSRRLQTTVTGNVNVGTATTAPTSTTTAPTSTTSTPTSTSTPTPSTGGTSSSSGSASVGDNTGSDSGSGSSTSDVMSCDSTFYSQWDTLGIKCGGSSLDVDSAVSASSCVIYSGTVGSISGSTCVSICSFPACTNGAWDYSASNGLSSSVYSGLELDSFMNTTIITALEERSSAVSTFLSNSTMTSDEQCSYSSEDSFSSCTCSATIVSSSSYDSAKKQERENDEADGVITEDSTTDTGTIVASTSKSVAGVTVVVSGIAAVASTIASSTSTATASLTMAGSTAVTTVELCQFAVFVNMLDLDGKSSALSLFGKQMAPANFMFLPFGKLDDDDDSDGSSSGSDSTSGSGTRRRLSSDSGSSGSSGTSSGLSGMAKYARMIGIKEDMLFIVTLAGVICVMAGVVALFGLGYLIAGLFMPREEFLTKFFDKMIGLEILVAILSQYTLGVTGTYQIYYSFSNDDPTDPKCILAIVALLFLACGIILYGYIVVKKHEAEIADVGTVQHLKKTVNMRYGPFYEEYKYKNRFFFTIKLMVALATGVVTGFVGISSTVQVGIVLAINVFFFFYLEIQSPHHSRFVQTATSFVSIMKIAVLVLTFFLISAATSDGFPTSLQNGISLAIVGLNLFALVLLMIRSLYMFWKKYQLQREARFDEEEQTAQDYFKDETPQQRKDRELTNSSHQAGVNLQSQQSTNPYVQGNQNYDYEGGDEIRLRSGTHMQEQAEEVSYNQQHTQVYDVNRNTATNYYANDRASAAQRRNDVVEL